MIAMRKYWILILFSILYTGNVFPQSYRTAIGIRTGLPFGVTFKRFINEHSAFEVLAGTRWGGVTFSGLYEWHKPTNQYPSLNWYFGGGAAMGFYDKRSPWVYEDQTRMIIGVQGIIGMEYTFNDVPLNLGFDWIPLFNMIGFSDFDFIQFAISGRYVF